MLLAVPRAKSRFHPAVRPRSPGSPARIRPDPTRLPRSGPAPGSGPGPVAVPDPARRSGLSPSGPTVWGSVLDSSGLDHRPTHSPVSERWTDRVHRHVPLSFSFEAPGGASGASFWIRVALPGPSRRRPPAATPSRFRVPSGLTPHSPPGSFSVSSADLGVPMFGTKV
jgi:hypothetical protein